ncbi:uncharacterized protein LOC125758637 [Rhipicephalus sanguineus]|uniref:uncharacterized protein LOC125758637 n=1 Tax=Rhipicephalus sanguineus TaxID=34632 RepID=UPI0020C437FF|nr:uncharacterized protein LOC125758637 [Rhipicephalus sanguineus]
MAGIKPPKPFDFHNAADWPAWMDEFDDYRFASGLHEKTDEVQVRTLLYTMGRKSREILRSLNVKDEEMEDFKLVKSKFNDYFVHTKNIVYESARFNQRRQQLGETVDQFATELSKLADRCEFEGMKERLIRDRFVVGLRDQVLSEELQMDPKLTMATALIKLSEECQRLTTFITPYGRLLNKDSDWSWGPQQEAAFEKIKTTLSSDRCLARYNPRYSTIVSADASSLVIGAVLLQDQPSAAPFEDEVLNRLPGRDGASAVERASKTTTLVAADGMDLRRTTDVVHPSYVAADDFTGEVTWIKQVLEEHSVCLPMAKVTISGPFGELVTEAAVSKMVPLEYPYLFSNRSDRLLRERGQKFGEGRVQALTRSKTRQLAAQLTQNSGADTPESEQTYPKSVETTEEESGFKTSEPEEVILEGSGCADAETEEPESESDGKGLLLAPGSLSFEKLLQVDRGSLGAEQKKDPSLARLHLTAKEGIARRNITMHEKGGLLYRHYKDRKGKILDQLVVPEMYRRDILSLCHGNGWSGHLGVKKTKERLLMEYYWPGCFKDVELLVKSCDACQRVGKPGDKWKAPLRLVPLITEPFRRLVIDTVGPLPKSKSGYRYLLTMLCPATKFPEAIPLKELSSSEIVDALLTTFSRIGFPTEIQADQGTVFTSALTTTFLRKCGVRLLHSSVYHPQSNSVEKLHSVLKRVLRALCYEHREDWESCLPAALFALRTAPHEATGFTPAELVYGRTLRSPLRMLRELWEGTGESQTVVAYVLQLLERLSVTRKLVEEAACLQSSSTPSHSSWPAIGILAIREFPGPGGAVMIAPFSPSLRGAGTE